MACVAAVVQVQSLAWELPEVPDAAGKKKKERTVYLILLEDLTIQ